MGFYHVPSLVSDFLPYTRCSTVLHNFTDLKILAYTMFSWVQIIEMSSSNEPRRLSGLLLSNPYLGPCPHFTGEKTDTCLGLDINPQPTISKQADAPGPLHRS